MKKKTKQLTRTTGRMSAIKARQIAGLRCS